MVGPKVETIRLYAHVPGSTALRARRSASTMGRLCGGDEKREEHVDFPVAIEPVRPMRCMLLLINRSLSYPSRCGQRLDRYFYVSASVVNRI